MVEGGEPQEEKGEVVVVEGEQGRRRRGRGGSAGRTGQD